MDCIVQNVGKKIVQDTELKIFYAFDVADVEMLHYSSPNELLYVK